MRALCMRDGLAPPFTSSGNADNCLITVMVPVSDMLQDLRSSKGWDPLLKNQEGSFFLSAVVPRSLYFSSYTPLGPETLPGLYRLFCPWALAHLTFTFAVPGLRSSLGQGQQ